MTPLEFARDIVDRTVFPGDADEARFVAIAALSEREDVDDPGPIAEAVVREFMKKGAT